MADETTPETLRDENATLKSQIAELQASQKSAERAAAFSTAGIDTSTPQGKFFSDNYQGELKPESIQGKYSELWGAPQQPQAPQQAPVPSDGAVMVGPNGQPIVPGMPPGVPQPQFQAPPQPAPMVQPQFQPPPTQPIPGWNMTQGMAQPQMPGNPYGQSQEMVGRYTPEQVANAFGNLNDASQMGPVQTGNNNMNTEVLAAIRAESGLDGAESGILPPTANADMAKIWELGSQNRLSELGAHLRTLGIQMTGAISA